MLHVPKQEVMNLLLLFCGAKCQIDHRPGPAAGHDMTCEDFSWPPPIRDSCTRTHATFFFYTVRKPTGQRTYGCYFIVQSAGQKLPHQPDVDIDRWAGRNETSRLQINIAFFGERFKTLQLRWYYQRPAQLQAWWSFSDSNCRHHHHIRH